MLLLIVRFRVAREAIVGRPYRTGLDEHLTLRLSSYFGKSAQRSAAQPGGATVSPPCAAPCVAPRRPLPRAGAAALGAQVELAFDTVLWSAIRPGRGGSVLAGHLPIIAAEQWLADPLH
jgi:hypothetical protein